MTKNTKYDFDLVNNSFSRDLSQAKKNILHINRNTLFIDIVRDFMLLARATRLNPFIPRLDKLRCRYLIVHAWEAENLYKIELNLIMIIGHIGARKIVKKFEGKNFRCWKTND